MEVRLQLLVVVPATASSGTVSVMVNKRTAVAPGEFCVADPAPTITANQTVIPASLTSDRASGNQWYRNGVAIAGATGSTLEVTQPGNYTVTATGECESAMSNTIEIVITALEEAASAERQQIRAYPSPAESLITMDFPDFDPLGKIAVDVYSAMGKSIERLEATTGPHVTVNISGYTPGLYFIRARQYGKIAAGKFFKK